MNGGRSNVNCELKHRGVKVNAKCKMKENAIRLDVFNTLFQAKVFTATAKLKAGVLYLSEVVAQA